MDKNGWSVQLTLVVKGPNEGAVINSVEYEDTTKELAVGIQNKLLELGIKLNKEGV